MIIKRVRRRKSTEPRKPIQQSEASILRRKDFATASKAAALIRKVFLSATKEFWDDKVLTRLRSKTVEIINTGPEELRGKLQITDGDIRHLTVNFNEARSLVDLLKTQMGARFENGENLIINIPKINFEKYLTYPDGATSFVFRFVCGIFHFDLGKGGAVRLPDLEIPISKEIYRGAKVKIPLQSAENSVVMIAICMWFKSKNEVIKNPRWIAAEIKHAFHFVDGKMVHFKYPEKIKKDPPPVEEQKDNLQWELGDE